MGPYPGGYIEVPPLGPWRRLAFCADPYPLAVLYAGGNPYLYLLRAAVPSNRQFNLRALYRVQKINIERVFYVSALSRKGPAPRAPSPPSPPSEELAEYILHASE